MITSARDYIPYQQEAANQFLSLSKNGMNAVFLYSKNICHKGQIIPMSENHSVKTICVDETAFVPVEFFTHFYGASCKSEELGFLFLNSSRIRCVRQKNIDYVPLLQTARLLGYEAKAYYENRLFVTGTAQQLAALDNDEKLVTAGAYLVCGQYTPEKCGHEDYRKARMNWRQLLVGSPQLNDMTVPAIFQKINDISLRCQEKWATLNKAEDRPILWGDHAPTESADLMHQSLALADLAKGWGTYGSEFYHNEKLYADIIAGVKWLHEKMYGRDIIEGTGWRDAHLFNWYHWYTAFPENMTDIFFILEDPDLGTDPFTLEEKREFFAVWQWLTTFHFVGFGRDKSQARSSIYAKVALTVEDPERMYAVYVDYDLYIGLTENDNGPRVDYTHWWHGAPYNICYGGHNLDRMMRVLFALSGTTLEITSPQIYGWFNICKYMYEPAMYKGQGMIALNGRFIQTSEMYMGAWLLVRMLLMIGLFGEEEDRYIRKMIRRNADTPDLIAQMKSRGFIQNCVQLDEILSSEEDSKYEYAHAWFTGDRAAWHRSNYAAAFAVHSKREAAFECINKQNMTGWHEGDGAQYLYTDYDRHQYDGVNFVYKNREVAYHYPGTTEDRREREIRHIIMPKEFRVSKTFAGALTLEDRYLTCAMDFESYHYEGPDIREDKGGYGMGPAVHKNDLRAKKAWFCFDEELVALGADITSTMNSPVDTTVEHRRLVNEALYGQIVCTGLSSERLGQTLYEKPFANPSWVCMEGHAGYYFPQGGNVHVRRYICQPDNESGEFGNNLEEGIIWENARQPFFELRLEHGANPEKATYAYVVIPYASAQELEEYAKSPRTRILSNIPALQAVCHDGLGITGFVFYEPGTLEGLTTDQPVMLMQRRDGTSLQLRITDPTHELSCAAITLDGEYKCVSCHERITVTVQNGYTKLSIDFANANGRGLQVVLQKAV